MMPLEIADSGRCLLADLKQQFDTFYGEASRLLDMVAVINVVDPHWLVYPLDRLAAISGEFGAMYNINGVKWQHEGIDLSITQGNAVRACADGKVIFAGVKAGYGNCVRIEHDREDEKWWTWYGHLSVISVLTWTRVKADDLIGMSGATGNVTGPHLHLTVQRASCSFLPQGCAETLRGVVNPRDWVKWPI